MHESQDYGMDCYEISMENVWDNFRKLVQKSNKVDICKKISVAN